MRRTHWIHPHHHRPLLQLSPLLCPSAEDHNGNHQKEHHSGGHPGHDEHQHCAGDGAVIVVVLNAGKFGAPLRLQVIVVVFSTGTDLNGHTVGGAHFGVAVPVAGALNQLAGELLFARRRGRRGRRR